MTTTSTTPSTTPRTVATAAVSDPWPGDISMDRIINPSANEELVFLRTVGAHEMMLDARSRRGANTSYKMSAGTTRDPDVREMIQNPDDYFNDAREAARKEAEEAFKREEEFRRRK